MITIDYKKLKTIIFVLILSACSILFGCDINSNTVTGLPVGTTEKTQAPPVSQASKNTIQLPDEDQAYKNKNRECVVVERVVDGDTFIVAGGKRVRLIGIDTPETVKPGSPVETYGKEASNFTKEVLEGKMIYMESDVQDTDKYGRQLRYVYLADGTFFNEYLVREGYANVMTVPPNVAKQDIFLQAQNYARNNKKGLWGL